MQERFESLIKQRLLAEYENNPPLFPWETEVSEYPAEVLELEAVTNSATAEVSATWGAYVSTLKVPGLLPQAVLTTLFERCQEIARTPVKQGVRLVRAVESLFPQQTDLLEPIANMVLVPAYRSGETTKAAVTQELANVAGGYDSALPEQQIALSMLAAQEILGALTLSVSTDHSEDSRRWVVPIGVLELSATYINDQLIISAVLPSGGTICLCDGEVEKAVSRQTPGSLSLVLSSVEAHKTHQLKVSLQSENTPLSFAVHVGDISL